jgi:hypothetical protein
MFTTWIYTYLSIIAVWIILFVGFEVLTPVVMKSTIFWDKTPCSPLKVSRRFGETYRLHLQGRKMTSAACHLLSRWFHLSLFFSTLKMEVIFSSEMSAVSQLTTRRTLNYAVCLSCFWVVGFCRLHEADVGSVGLSYSLPSRQRYSSFYNVGKHKTF